MIIPGLIFLFGVWEPISFFLGVGVNVLGWQFFLLMGWQFFLSEVFLILSAGSLVPPATSSVGFCCILGKS